MSRKHKFHNPTAAYFVSFATVYWIDVFTRQEYFNILVESIDYCRKEKGMELFAYCFMPNHVHFVFRDSKEDPMSLLRDFKKYTSKRILKAIEENPSESRKEWLLWMFKRAGKEKGNVSKYQFWQHNNKPIELWSATVIKQKIDYIHNNPVVSGFVSNPIGWKYSSANNFANDHTVLRIDNIGFLG
ncbi:REP-associated tyrosine transposase [Psychroserpens sp. NJDZ02]|uniref:REP-associated tyrosine transposase n=1 Tax=Psychroserpens sp. NJDZ02 TaxID=2570561 RepID=UPI0010A9054C|nr:transposase [Psychroserpens sp. NJDZ02]QCE43122.1 transposase [Psychroserpens sp. NJDZ02]